MTSTVSTPWKRALVLVLVACFVTFQVLGAVAGTPSRDLKEIQYKYYFRGQYDQAVELLQTYLARTDLSKPDAVAAREFLAASYILSGAREKGKEQFLKLLNADTSYPGPDAATFKPEVMAVFENARDELASARLKTAPAVATGAQASVPAGAGESKPIYKKWWFYTGLAALAVVVVAVSHEDVAEEPKPSAPTGSVNVGVQVR